MIIICKCCLCGKESIFERNDIYKEDNFEDFNNNLRLDGRLYDDYYSITNLMLYCSKCGYSNYNLEKNIYNLDVDLIGKFDFHKPLIIERENFKSKMISFMNNRKVNQIKQSYLNDDVKANLINAVLSETVAYDITNNDKISTTNKLLDYNKDINYKSYKKKFLKNAFESYVRASWLLEDYDYNIEALQVKKKAVEIACNYYKSEFDSCNFGDLCRQVGYFGLASKVFKNIKDNNLEGTYLYNISCYELFLINNNDNSYKYQKDLMNFIENYENKGEM